ncbi:MAG: hypothetical protein KBS59_07035 [Clostridiales bacterium]|nr:hypothetical protein [Clostridiales bacterium]
MENKSGFHRFLDYIEEHKLAAVAILLVVGCVVWSVVRKATAPDRDEQVNFAVTAFGYHSDGKEEELLEQVAADGIKEVNLSFYDISDTSGMAGYLLTYGYRMSDILILDTALGQSVLRDCFYVFPEKVTEELSKAAGFDLHFVKDDGNAVGVLVHENGNDAYNAHFRELNGWLLFAADGTEYDFAVFFNVNSIYNETENLNLLKYILK